MQSHLVKIQVSYWLRVPKGSVPDIDNSLPALDPEYGQLPIGPAQPGQPAHPIYRPGARPIDPAYGIEEGQVEPPIFFPGDPEQGLPPIVGWPLPEEGTPAHPLPPTIERPVDPAHPIAPGGRPPRPGHPIARPPVIYPGRPEQGLPPIVGWPLPEEECSPVAKI